MAILALQHLCSKYKAITEQITSVSDDYLVEARFFHWETVGVSDSSVL